MLVWKTTSLASQVYSALMFHLILIKLDTRAARALVVTMETELLVMVRLVGCCDQKLERIKIILHYIVTSVRKMCRIL